MKILPLPSFLNTYNKLKTIQPSGTENYLNLKSLEKILAAPLHLNAPIVFYGYNEIGKMGPGSQFL